MAIIISGAARALSMRCPIDGGAVEFVDSAKVYHGKSYGMIYLCKNYPKCTGRVGCHPDGRPLGTLADDATRAARRKTHAIFDRIWQEKHMTRGEAYTGLAKFLGLREAHIGESDVEQCRKIRLYAKLVLDES